MVSEVVEVTYRPDCWFAFKSGSMSEDLSPFQKLFILFYNGILKVKEYVNNAVHILTVSHRVVTFSFECAVPTQLLQWF